MMAADFSQIRMIAWETICEALGIGTTTDAALILQLKTYTVATLPSASTYVRGIVYCSNETGGAVPVFSDGTNWRRVTDRAVAS